MRVDNKIIICDLCGSNTVEHPDMDWSFVEFTHGHFYEEPSFGCGSDSESELYQLLNERDVEDDYEIHSTIGDIAHTPKIEMCDSCFHEQSEDDFISEFDNKLRQRRGEILLRLIKENKVLPGFRNEDDTRKKKLLQLKEKETKLKEELIENAKGGYGTDHLIRSLMDIAIMRDKIK